MVIFVVGIAFINLDKKNLSYVKKVCENKDFVMWLCFLKTLKY